MNTLFPQLTRRQFVRQMAAGGITLTALMSGLSRNLMAQQPDNHRPIIWLKGESAGTDRSGFWNIPGFPDFLDQFFKPITQTELRSEFSLADYSDTEPSHILILEGYFSDNSDDPLNALLKDLIVVSRVAILLGNISSYSNHAPDGYLDLEKNLLYHVETPFLKLPGEPVHARHLLGVLNHLVLYGLPELDIYRRPTMFYSTLICERCEYRSDFEAGRFVHHFGEKEGCLYLLGCKGPVTRNSCPIDRWNGTSEWCVSAGSPCTGCSEPEYPLHGGLGMFGQLSDKEASVNSFFVRNLDTIAKGTAVLAAAGIATHAISKRASSPIKGQRLPILEEDEE